MNQNTELLFRMTQPLDLVKELVDQIPKEIFESKTTTFLDPAMGGGDYLREIANRLLAAGHSVENVKSRIFGMESHMIFLNRSIARNIGKFSIMGYNAFLEGGIKNMKFDVVIGNPPYQDGSRSRNVIAGGGKKNLYTKFFVKSMSLLKKDGYLAFITPPGLFKATQWGISSPDMKDVLENNLKLLKLSGVKEHFPGIGTRICYYVVQKNKDYQGTRVISDGEMVVDVNEFGMIPFTMNEHTFSIIRKMTSPTVGDRMNWKRDAKNVGPDALLMTQLQGNPKDGKYKISETGDRELIGKNGTLSFDHSDPEKVRAFMNSAPLRWWNIVLRHNPIVYRGLINGIRISTDLQNLSDEGIMEFYGFSKEEKTYIQWVFDNAKKILKG